MWGLWKKEIRRWIPIILGWKVLERMRKRDFVQGQKGVLNTRICES